MRILIMDEHLIINLRVADQRYPIKIQRKDEEVLRKAANEIDYKLSQYKRYFTEDSNHTLEDKDYMAMTAIQAVKEKVEQECRINGFERKIKSLIGQMDSYLKERR